jgi:H-NS histone family
VRWEYRKILLNEHHRKGDDVDLLSAAGEDDWELVAITPHNVAYLKRPIIDETEDAHSSGVAAKYLDPATGETWSGRGRMANWLKRKQDAGEDIEKYRV